MNFKNQKLELILFNSGRYNNTRSGIINKIWVCFILIFAIIKIQFWTFSYMQNKYYKYFLDFVQSRLKTHVYDMKLLIIYLYCSVSSMLYISFIDELYSFSPIDCVYTVISILQENYQTGICKKCTAGDPSPRPLLQYMMCNSISSKVKQLLLWIRSYEQGL